MLGPGKYDKELTKARESAGATSALLIVVDGNKGPGFSCQTTLPVLAKMPELLEEIARQMRADRSQQARNYRGASKDESN